MPNNLILGLVVTLIFGGAIGFFFGFDYGVERGMMHNISSFEECKDAGYPIMESYPEQCQTPDGKHFVNEVEEEEEVETAPQSDEQEESPIGTSPMRPLPVACPMDALICPDGTALGRQGPNCEFPPCP